MGQSPLLRPYQHRYISTRVCTPISSSVGGRNSSRTYVTAMHAVCAVRADRSLTAIHADQISRGPAAPNSSFPERGGERRSRQRGARRGYKVERPPDPLGFGSLKSTTDRVPPFEANHQFHVSLVTDEQDDWLDLTPCIFASLIARRSARNSFGYSPRSTAPRPIYGPEG